VHTPCLRNGVRLQADTPKARRSEFQRFPIFCCTQLGTRRAVKCGRLFWITFFDEAKKVISCRATPDLYKIKYLHQLFSKLKT
jgi:hypothetical protein